MAYLRYFYIISFILVVAAFISAGTFGRYFIENNIIRVIGEHHNRAIAQNFTLAVWKKHEKTLARLPCRQEPCPDTSALQNDVRSFFRSLPVLSYRVIADNGVVLFTQESFLPSGEDKHPNQKGFSTAKTGQFYTDLTFHDNVYGGDFNVVRSFVPIIPDTSTPLRRQRIPAVIEVVYDITPFWANPMQIQTYGIFIIVGVFVFIFSIMYFATYKTEQLITRQYEANVDLIKGKALAEAENREKSQFLASVSHELRTPLNAIIGFSEIIKDEVMGPLNNQQYKDYINDIHISGVHLLSLINDILDYSKADAGKLNVDLNDVDVTKIMQNSVRLITPRANEASVKLVTEIPEEHYILKTDGKRLKQVVLNLLSNAVKFTPSGGSVTLYAWHNIAENKFVIEVQDTGVGIAAKDISKVMSTFGQVENKLSRQHEGTGLGLPLSKKLVELMGGRLELQSKLGEGTVVKIALPYRKADQSRLSESAA